jgi:DUF1680 family protein
VREATTVEGHAVRAVYLTTGAADVAIETSDAELLAALGRQYDQMAATKQYVTGGLGSRWEGEAFGDPYELPSDRAYAETCAAIGAVQWAWRMLLATGEAFYADQIERLLFNGFLAGVSLRGGDYFYVNPLHVRHDAHADDERTPKNGRLRWFGCACCPPNIMRTLSSLGGYLATSTTDGVQLHQYVAGDVAATTDAGDVALAVDTAYPWDGRVSVTVTAAPERPISLSLRVPSWAHGAILDGANAVPGSYATVTRSFTAGDTIELLLPVQPRVTRPHARVDAVRGSIAIERGPLVYVFERTDQPGGVVLDDVAVQPESVAEADGPGLVPGLVGVSVQTRDGQTLTGIPYFAWANRGADDMRVWLPEG